MGQIKTIVVDGSNVAYTEQTGEGKPRVSNLVAVRRALQEKGFEPIIVVDATLMHQVDDPEQLDALIEQQVLRQAPAGTDADYFVLEIAEHEDADVVSNDLYDQYREEFPWIKERRVPLMIVEGRVHLYEKDFDAAKE